MYSGEWCEGVKEGEGEMVWGGGRERYNGHWVNDSPNGHGVYVWQSQPPVLEPVADLSGGQPGLLR